MNMTKNGISYREMYELLDKRLNEFESMLEKKFDHVYIRMERIEARTGVLENFNSNLMGKFTAAWIGVTIAVTILVDFVKQRLFKL